MHGSSDRHMQLLFWRHNTLTQWDLQWREKVSGTREHMMLSKDDLEDDYKTKILPKKAWTTCSIAVCRNNMKQNQVDI